jgi:hypothetical protein
MTPTELGKKLGGPQERGSRSRAAYRVRVIARELYGLSPDHRWYFTADQVAEISSHF